MGHARVTISAERAQAVLTSADAAVHAAAYNLCAPKAPEDWKNPQYKRRRRAGWDGRYQFYAWDGDEAGTLGVGLVPWLVGCLRAAGHTVSVEDPRAPITLQPVPALEGVTWWAHQQDALRALLDSAPAELTGVQGVLAICTGGGKTLVTAGIAGMLGAQHPEELLVLVPRAGLVTNTRKCLQKFFGDDMVGSWDRPAPMVVDTVQKLAAGLDRAEEETCERLRRYRGLVLDEAHHLAGISTKAKANPYQEQRFPEGIFAAVAQRCPAPLRVALSGTPLTECTHQNWALTAAFGQQVYRVGYADLIRAGILARPSFLIAAVPGRYTGALYRQRLLDEAAALESAAWDMEDERRAMRARVKAAAKRDEAEGVQFGKRCKAPVVEVHRELLASNTERDLFVALVARALAERGLKTLVLVRMVEHGERQAEAIARELGQPVPFVSGRMTGKQQAEAFAAFGAQGPRSVLVANTVADEGVDVPDVRCVILAGGGKSYVTTIQRLGRGIRGKEDDNRVLVIDLVDLGHKYPHEHGKKRVQEYDRAGVAEGVFDILGAVPAQLGPVLDKVEQWTTLRP